MTGSLGINKHQMSIFYDADPIFRKKCPYCVQDSFVNMTQAEVISEEGISIKKMPPHDQVVGKPTGHFLN